MSDPSNPFGSVEGKIVLVVDDDAMVRSILIEYLQGFGFKAIVDGINGRNALKLMKDPKLHFDLVLSDWQMPEVDGLFLLKIARNLPYRRDVKFIMITSQGPEERIKITQARQAGVNAYIIKPFRGNTLKEKIWHVLWGDKSDGDTIEGLEEPTGTD